MILIVDDLKDKKLLKTLFNSASAFLTVASVYGIMPQSSAEHLENAEITSNDSLS